MRVSNLKAYSPIISSIMWSIFIKFTPSLLRLLLVSLEQGSQAKLFARVKQFVSLCLLDPLNCSFHSLQDSGVSIPLLQPNVLHYWLLQAKLMANLDSWISHNLVEKGDWKNKSVQWTQDIIPNFFHLSAVKDVVMQKISTKKLEFLSQRKLPYHQSSPPSPYITCSSCCYLM